MNIISCQEDHGLALAVEDLVVNWHLTEACNYGCQYCYSTWVKPQERTELHRDMERTFRLLAELRQFFDPENVSNPLRRTMRWNSVRLSIAGGEATLLGGRLETILAEAARLGFKVSLITNGSLLDEARIAALAPKLSCLGISVDSIDPRTNQRIGRMNRHGKTLSEVELCKLVALAREANPAITIKLNTVVNAENAAENLTGTIAAVAPDRWKVLRVLPVVSDRLAVSSADFQAFIERHQHFRAIMSAEDNHDMTESYIMVDPHGRFFQNSDRPDNGAYSFSERILDVGAKVAFAQIGFAGEKFVGRYRTIPLVSAR